VFRLLATVTWQVIANLEDPGGQAQSGSVRRI
jgi:hypothetical protein